LALKRKDRVLEIGTGCGYQTAVLAQLAGRVVTIERIASLSQTAQLTLTGLGFDNIDFWVADGTQDFRDDLGNFDAIMITAATPRVPGHWFDVLKEGGRLVAPVGERSGQMLTLYTKIKDNLKIREIGRCVFVPLIGEYGFSL
jgi:protein-L-isoaspartate(D-aspartate) O-methyltransferase